MELLSSESGDNTCDPVQYLNSQYWGLVAETRSHCSYDAASALYPFSPTLPESVHRLTIHAPASISGTDGS
jgi:hypothetical protein